MSERENKSRARLRVVNERGDLYAAESANGLWIKIGFSTRLADRLKAINYDYPSAAPFRLLGSTSSTFDVEQSLHRSMKPFHQIHIGAGKELYPAAPAVKLIVERLIVSKAAFDGVPWEQLRSFRTWCREQAAAEHNRAVAEVAHAPRFAAAAEAERRYFERIMRRIAARQAARAA